jgi:hypothetical protein
MRPIWLPDRGDNYEPSRAKFQKSRVGNEHGYADVSHLNPRRHLPTSRPGQGRKPALFVRRAFFEQVATRSARGTVRAPWPANETYLWPVSSRRFPRPGAAIVSSAEAADLDEDLKDVSCALRSKAEVGPSARTRERGTTRTLAGSMRYDESQYTRTRDRAYAAASWRRRRHGCHRRDDRVHAAAPLRRGFHVRSGTAARRRPRSGQRDRAGHVGCYRRHRCAV